jgi:RNA polymerase sigma-70 factor (ECF subfamily)
MSRSSNELLARSTKKPALFVEVFERHGRAIHSYLVRRAGSQQGEDLFSEVWLRAFKARATYDPSRGDALPWIYGVARNTLRSHWRCGTRASTRTRSTYADDAPNLSYDPWPDVDGEMDALRLSAALHEALAALEPADREVILLSAWEQLEPKEIAEVLGMPAGTVRWRLHKARSALQNTNLRPTPTPQEIRQ